MRVLPQKAKIQKLPGFIGVYLFKKGNKVLYIGKSINVKVRLLTHLENALLDRKEAVILEHSTVIECIETDSEFKALLLESKLIQKHQPPYNTRWKDNKSYLYIKITISENYPKIYPTRKEKSRKSLYFGPFSSLRNVHQVLSLIRRIFPFCTQKKLTSRVCFYSKLGLCSPCPNEIDQIDELRIKKAIKRTYRVNVKRVIKILQGNIETVEKDLYKKLSELIKDERYEEALSVRNKLFLFQKLINQRLFTHHSEEIYNLGEKSLKELEHLLQFHLPKVQQLKRIECYDISNLSQREATASMVVLQDGRIYKDAYRKFRIKNLKARSDLEMLEETVRRRFHNDWPTPDLIVVDGGKPQLRTLLKTLKGLNMNIPIIGIAKNPDRLVIGTDTLPTVKPATNNLGFNLIRQIRDESHRFARKYHLFLRNRKYGLN